jgi:hypothetical protein
VPVGDYSLSIDKAGFNKVQIDQVRVQVGQATTEDVSMRPGAETQTIQVTAAELLRQESSISSVVDQALLDGLPLSGRRYTDFALLTPNASQDGQTGLVSIGGEPAPISETPAAERRFRTPSAKMLSRNFRSPSLPTTRPMVARRPVS